MNIFNEALLDMMSEILGPLKITEKEENAMIKHYSESAYSRLHITSARRDKEGILCVKYDDGEWFHYRNGEWW